jgi:hypothetical protein
MGAGYIYIPLGYGTDASTLEVTASGGENWYVGQEGSDIYLAGSTTSDVISTGQTVTVTFSETTISANSYTWTTTAYSYTNFTSLLTLSGSQPSVTVNAALTAPVVSVTPTTVDAGQSATLSVTTDISGGTASYSYQWKSEVPGAESYSALGSASSSATSPSTGALSTTGTWSFELVVTDSGNPAEVVTSNVVTVTVNAVPTVSIAPVGPVTLGVGQSQMFTATASGGTGTLSYQWYLDGSAVSGATETQQILSPWWSASYSYTPAAAGSHSVTCKVTDSASTPVTSAASNAVTITVLIQLTITVTQGANGMIAPATTIVNSGGSQKFSITPNTGYHVADVIVDSVPQGAVSSYAFTNVLATHTITASFGLNINTTTIITGILSNTTTVPITQEGNITVTQFLTNITITPTPLTTTTTVSFTITGPSGTAGFGNMTIPKTSIPYGTTPLVYINGTLAANQGYTQDANNYYVWYTTQFSTHQVTIQFTTPKPSPTPLPTSSTLVFFVSIAAAAVIIILIVLAITIKRNKRKT